jgi:hypothetical protein
VWSGAKARSNRIGFGLREKVEWVLRFGTYRFYSFSFAFVEPLRFGDSDLFAFAFDVRRIRCLRCRCGGFHYLLYAFAIKHMSTTQTPYPPPSVFYSSSRVSGNKGIHAPRTDQDSVWFVIVRA